MPTGTLYNFYLNILNEGGKATIDCFFQILFRIWLFCAVADGVQCHSLLTRYKPGTETFDDILFSMGFTQAAMLATYLISLLMYLLGSPGDDYERLAPDYQAR